jgi:RimJ/RimL family protein N-acetyltransferase
MIKKLVFTVIFLSITMSQAAQTKIPESFTTERLRAERTTAHHIEYVRQIISSPEVQKSYGFPEVVTPEAPSAQLSIATGQWERYSYGLYTLFDIKTSAFIGFSGFHAVSIDEQCTIDWVNANKEGNTLELYGFLMPEYWRQGYGMEMGIKLIELARNHLPHSRIIAYINPQNHPSQQITKKLGFTQIGTVLYNNEQCLLYELPMKVTVGTPLANTA